MAEEELGNLVFADPQQEEDDETRQAHLSESSDYEDEDEKQRLSKFLAEFPIQPLYTKRNDKDGWCFWSQTESSQANSSLDNPRSVPVPWTIHEKIKSVFTNLGNCRWGFVQFWVPVTRSGRRLLTTCDQPFAVTLLDTGFAKHRICCENYLYDVDIINGPPATAFLNRLPQLIHDLRRYSLKMHLYPLLASALEHRLTSYIVLPIFDPSTKDCVGVVEHCNIGYYYGLLHQSIAAIKEADLITFDPRECRLCNSIDGLQHARDEIEEALKTVCVSHKLCLAQAWIRYEDKNHESFLSSTERNCNDFEFMQNKRGLALKLRNYYKRDWDWERFCQECDIRPLIMGEGLVGKALQNHEPYLCQDISTVDKNEPSLSHTLGIKGDSFAICLRSIYTQNLDYVLEFFWDQNHDYDSDFFWDYGRNVIILLESIMFTLKRTLPSFKVVTGEEIGSELCVKEITYSSKANKCVIKDIVILRHNTSPISLHQEVIEQEFRKTIIEGAENLNGIPSFKVATSEEIGCELCVKEITHSSKANECIGEDIVISQPTNEISKRKHKTSLISLPREVIKKHFGSTQIEAAKNFNVSLSTLKRKCKDAGIDDWPGPKSGKSKVRDSQGGQNGMNGEDIPASQGPSVINQYSISDGTVLTIKAQYGKDIIKFRLPFSTTLQAVEEEISNKFSLKYGTYKLEYRDEENDLVTITCDNDFRDCAKSSRSLNSTTIRLYVKEKPATKIA